MHNKIITELNIYQQQATGYNTLFNYRLMNLCVKAEPASLLPVTVTYLNNQFDMEEVAEMRKPDDYHFEIRPKNPNNIDDIINGIFDVHPEFELEIKTEKDPGDNDVKYLYYTMPPVNKERYDLLTELTKTFHKECLAKQEITYNKKLAEFTGMLAFPNMLAEADEDKKALKDIYDTAKKEADKMKSGKLQEIEEGYQRYLEGKAQAEEDEANKFDYSKGIRLNTEE